MGYLQPIVIYKTPNAEQKDSVIRYIGNRVKNSNKNMLICVVGPTGSGKSWSCISMAERYSKMFDVEFNPQDHIISSLKELLLLITNKEVDHKIKFGTAIVFDEPQVDGNARNWQSEMNKALGQLISTFRNQRLVVFFATPYLEFIDKQSRILFHAEFKILGYDKTTGITKIKPRFLEYNRNIDDFYRKRLIIESSVEGKKARNIKKLGFWNIEKASEQLLTIYEEKKKKFSEDLNKKLLAKITMDEKTSESRNKSEELLKVRELYQTYGDDFLAIQEQMPHLPPFTLQKYLGFIKKSLWVRGKRAVYEKRPTMEVI